VDEIGRLEREKKCLYSEVSHLVKKIQRKSDSAVIFVIRGDLIHEILSLLDFKPIKIWKIEEKPDEKKAKEISNFIIQTISK